MGEARRRKERRADAPPPDDFASIAVKIGRENTLDDDNLARVYETLTFLFKLYPKSEFMLYVEGYETENRAPHDIPEVQNYILRLGRKLVESGSFSKLAPATDLVFSRCALHSWGVPVVTLNDAGPLPWRLCDVQRMQAEGGWAP